METLYIILSAQFMKHVGYQVGVKKFNAVQTKDGRYVCAFNSLFEFPELFADGNTYEVEELSITDFPEPELPEDAEPDAMILNNKNGTFSAAYIYLDEPKTPEE